VVAKAASVGGLFFSFGAEDDADGGIMGQWPWGESKFTAEIEYHHTTSKGLLHASSFKGLK
jgi:hypothetical protein